MPSFAFPGLKELGKMILDMFIAIIQRILCGLVRQLMQIFSVPSCNDDLQEQMYGAVIPDVTNPLAKKALVDALLDFGIPSEPETLDLAADLVDQVSRFLTPRELCALLRGERVTDQIYTVINRVIKN